MEPGPDAIKQLERLQPTARWGWYQQEGCFSLLELYPVSQSEAVLYEPWGRRGPVFGAPFDPDKYQAVWLANFKPWEVQRGSFIPIIKRWMTSMRDRMVRSAERTAQEFENNIHECAGEQGERLYRDGQKSTESPVMVPYKFLTQQEKDSLTGDFHDDVKQGFMPNI